MVLSRNNLKPGEHKQAVPPRPFVLRRLHSLLGLWLAVYLFEHLLVNSQAALFFQDNGTRFISIVNSIHNLPYLKAIEIFFLGLPLLVHGIWGILYIRGSKLNARRTNGAQPALGQFKRNKAYSWQRITSWLLIVGILAHVVQMRFILYPDHIYQGDERVYMTSLTYNPALPIVSQRLGVQLYNAEQIREKQMQLAHISHKFTRNSHALSADLLSGYRESLVFEHCPHYTQGPFQLKEERFSSKTCEKCALASFPNRKRAKDVSKHTEDEEVKPKTQVNGIVEQEKWIRVALKQQLKKNEVLAVAPNVGTAFLLIIRQTFADPLMVVLYSLLVVTASYHAFNGLWTLMITWGITLTRHSQMRMRVVSTILMSVVIFLGLMAVWGTYWATLFQ